MAEVVKRRVKVLKAAYIDDPEVDAILILGECQEGRFRQQIPANNLLKGVFGDAYLKLTPEVREAGLKAFAATLEQRTEPFLMEFDPDLDKK